MSGDRFTSSEVSYPPLKPETLYKRKPPPAGLPNSIPNPLSIYQSKSTPLAKKFRSTDATVGRNVKEIESNTRWLRPDVVDPTFGIKGDTKEVLVRRSYRRLESSKLFNPPTVKEASLDQLSVDDPEVAGRFDPKNYVLVEESRLAELAALETILREEKARLGEQCAWIMNDYSFDARIPLPATRVAVRNLADADCSRLVKEITALHVAWDEYCMQRNYDRIGDVLHASSYLKSTPLSLRAMKLQKLNEAKAAKYLAFDRDSMLFEDDLSLLNQAHHRAAERKLDYDRYYVLATRYGFMSEEEYTIDERPGRRYWLRCQDAVVKFQAVWGLYWAIQRIKRRKGAMQMQKIARCWIYYRRYHPLVIFRLKYGKRTYYEFVLSRWKSYVRICKMCKDAFEFYLDRTWFHKCWYAWRKFAVDTRDERNRMLRRVLYGLINAGLVKTFNALKQNAIRNRYIKIKMRRNIGFPHFDMWCEYVDWSKTMKKINNAATMINKYVRLRRARKRYKAKKLIGSHLGAIIRAVVICIRIRKAVMEENFLLWEMKETQNLATIQNNEERSRQLKIQKAMDIREKTYVSELKRHFKTKYGRIQMQLSGHENKDDLMKTMLFQCARLHRNRERHDFRLKNKPLYSCVDPDCGAVFVSLAQYKNHWRNDFRHADNNSINDQNRFEGEDQSVIKRFCDETKIRKYAYPAPSITFANRTVENQEKKEQPLLKIVDFHLLLSYESIRKTMRRSLTRHMKHSVVSATEQYQQVNVAPAQGGVPSLESENELDIELDGNLKSMQIASDTAAPAGGILNFFTTPKIVPTGTVSIAEAIASNDFEDDSLQTGEDEQQPLLPNDESSSIGNADDSSSVEVVHADEEVEWLSLCDPVKKNIRNCLDLYDAIEEWRQFTTTSKEYNTKAIYILDHYLKIPQVDPVKEPNENDLEDYWENYDLDGYNTDDSDDTVLHEEKEEKRRNRETYRQEQLRLQEIALRGDFIVKLPEEDPQWWDDMIQCLDRLKYADHKGHYKQIQLPRTCLRMVLGLGGQVYNHWNMEAILPATIFDRLQYVVFRFLYHYYIDKSTEFKTSAEYSEYVEIAEKLEERRLQEMYWRAKHDRLRSIERWVHDVFMAKHLATYRMAEESATLAWNAIVDQQVDRALGVLIEENITDLTASEQANHESTNCIAFEMAESVLDDLGDELFHFYGEATVTALMNDDRSRHKMMVFAGLREKGFSIEKKLLVNVDMNASSSSLLDMLGGGDDETKNVEETLTESEEVVHEEVVTKHENELKKPSITIGRQMPGTTTNPGTPPKPSSEAIEEMKTQLHGKQNFSESPVKVGPGGNVINPIKNRFAGGPGTVPGEKDFMLSPVEISALKKLQNQVRRIAARNRMRKVFVKTWVKKWDNQYGVVYYANVKDGTSSWDAPALYKFLYPGRTW